MSKENMSQAQAKTVEKLADLVIHLQLNGEFALPEGVWESNDGGIWDMLRDIYFTLLPKEFQEEFKIKQFAKQNKIRAEWKKKNNLR